MVVEPTYQVVSFFLLSKEITAFLYEVEWIQLYIKIVELETIYNLAVEEVSIWDLLEAQRFILSYRILKFIFFEISEGPRMLTCYI